MQRLNAENTFGCWALCVVACQQWLITSPSLHLPSSILVAWRLILMHKCKEAFSTMLEHMVMLLFLSWLYLGIASVLNSDIPIWCFLQTLWKWLHAFWARLVCIPAATFIWPNLAGWSILRWEGKSIICYYLWTLTQWLGHINSCRKKKSVLLNISISNGTTKAQIENKLAMLII